MRETGSKGSRRTAFFIKVTGSAKVPGCATTFAAAALNSHQYWLRQTVAEAQVGFSIPIFQSVYERRFEAEIDILSGTEILVRGRMHDHRFDFEHTWRLRTPGYEVLEASAQQKAGQESHFSSELCERYSRIRGARIGRGFSKRVLTELGGLPGAQEHLFLAIEMARVGQQVFQVPARFKAQFAEHRGIGAASAAYNFWRMDRAYMPGLANSCYTYRDASAALFADCNVQIGFGTELYFPKPGEKRVFWREKRLCVSVKKDTESNTFYACETSMNDTIHDIMLEFELARDGVISNAKSEGLRLPYHGICENAQLRTARLNGTRVNKEYVTHFGNHVGGSEGCAHLFDLSIDLLRLFTF